jgi:hypothetical protein
LQRISQRHSMESIATAQKNQPPRLLFHFF